MPTRLLREGILDSDSVNALSYQAEVFYRRLMSAVDDFGRYDARPSVLRSRLFPLRTETVKDADISAWLKECESANLIAVYLHNSKPFLLFGKVDAARAKNSKYPQPPTHVIERLQSQTSVNNCAQTPTCATYSYSGSDANSDAGKETAESGGVVTGRPVEESLPDKSQKPTRTRKLSAKPRSATPVDCPTSQADLPANGEIERLEKPPRAPRPFDPYFDAIGALVGDVHVRAHPGIVGRIAKGMISEGIPPEEIARIPEVAKQQHAWKKVINIDLKTVLELWPSLKTPPQVVHANEPPKRSGYENFDERVAGEIRAALEAP